MAIRNNNRHTAFCISTKCCAHAKARVKRGCGHCDAHTRLSCRIDSHLLIHASFRFACNSGSRGCSRGGGSLLNVTCGGVPGLDVCHRSNGNGGVGRCCGVLGDSRVDNDRGKLHGPITMNHLTGSGHGACHMLPAIHLRCSFFSPRGVFLHCDNCISLSVGARRHRVFLPNRYDGDA